MISPSLEILKTRLDAVLCSLLWVTLLWQGVGLGDPRGPFQPRSFCDSVITEESSCTLYSSRNQHLSTLCLLNPSLCPPALKHTLTHTGGEKKKSKRKSHELLVLLLFLTSVGVFSYPRYRDKEPPALYFP